MLWLLLARLAAAADPDPTAADGPFAAIEDPRRLRALGEQALAAGDRATATAAFERHLARLEATEHLQIRANLLHALVLERLGDPDAAAAAYRAALPDDALKVVQVLRILSEHPARDALVTEAYDYVRTQVEAAKAGEPNVIYTTTKGVPKALQVMTTEEALAAMRGPEQRVSYCYIEDFDLSDIPDEDLPAAINLNRCVVGRIMASNKSLGEFAFKGFVLGETVLGKHDDEKGTTVKESTLDDLMFRDAVLLGPAIFAAIKVSGRRAYFSMTVFEDRADFKGAEISAVADFRFSSFGREANFRRMRLYQPVYFGGSRYRDDTVFTQVYSERDVYFNSMEFEGDVKFDGCEWQRGATFEDSTFRGEANFSTTKIGLGLNLSRVDFFGTVLVKDIKVGALDVMGAHFREDAFFMDAHIEGRTRFSLDEVTRHSTREHLDALLPLYRHYQGDEDNERPITTASSYGVVTIDDLTARIDKDISFANTVFGGYTVYEGVVFGQPGQPSDANFFNAQFLGETHFERTLWHAKADFTTIFGNEVAFNQAHFERSLVLDDAAISSRLTLTDATFSDTADLSMYGSEITSFQIDPAQVAGVGEPHRLFYERCALGRFDRSDVRFTRITGVDAMDDAALREACYAMAVDELVTLKASYGDRAMTTAEDDAYWWSRHHAAMAQLRFGGPLEKLSALVGQLLIFELCFGWGVSLSNLGVALVAATLLYAIAYRTLCADSTLSYDGREHKIRDISFVGLCVISLQSLIAINTGWDLGEDDHRFRFINTSQTLLGFIMLTFFVGAYTRMILA